MKSDRRSTEQIRRHYEVETALADRLRRATHQERLELYGRTYAELYSQIPDIPHLDPTKSGAMRAQEVLRQCAFLSRFLNPNSRFMEVGPGDCKLSIAIASCVRSVYAIDVTREVVEKLTLPSNVKFGLSDGCSIPVPDNTIDVVLSDQVIEHLHPEDAAEHLKNVRCALTTGGIYICITPNRIYGPHDVSKYFDDEAKGLHLQEYSATDLIKAFRAAGYSQVQLYTILPGGKSVHLPVFFVRIVEGLLDLLPRRLRLGLACSSMLKWVMRARVIGQK